MLATAAAAKLGGKEVVKINPGAKDLITSIILYFAVIYPPINPNPLARVPSIISISDVNPSCSDNGIIPFTSHGVFPVFHNIAVQPGRAAS